MNKLFCDECGDGIKVSWHNYESTLIDENKERATVVKLSIQGTDYDNDTDSFPKTHPIKHICKKCAIKILRQAIKELSAEYVYEENN